MKKYLVFIAILVLAGIGMAQDRNVKFELSHYEKVKVKEFFDETVSMVWQLDSVYQKYQSMVPDSVYKKNGSPHLKRKPYGMDDLFEFEQFNYIREILMIWGRLDAGTNRINEIEALIALVDKDKKYNKPGEWKQVRIYVSSDSTVTGRLYDFDIDLVEYLRSQLKNYRRAFNYEFNNANAKIFKLQAEEYKSNWYANAVKKYGADTELDSIFSATRTKRLKGFYKNLPKHDEEGSLDSYKSVLNAFQMELETVKTVTYDDYQVFSKAYDEFYLKYLEKVSYLDSTGTYQWIERSMMPFKWYVRNRYLEHLKDQAENQFGTVDDQYKKETVGFGKKLFRVSQQFNNAHRVSRNHEVRSKYKDLYIQISQEIYWRLINILL